MVSVIESVRKDRRIVTISKSVLKDKCSPIISERQGLYITE